MNPPEETQKEPEERALGRFAEASLALAASFTTSTLREHAERLARLTASDLMLMYEASSDGDELTLCAQWGLTPDVEPRFRQLAGC